MKEFDDEYRVVRRKSADDVSDRTVRQPEQRKPSEGRSPQPLSRRVVAPPRTEVVRRRAASDESERRTPPVRQVRSAAPQPEKRRNTAQRKKTAAMKKNAKLSIAAVIVVICLVALIFIFHTENPEKLEKSSVQLGISEYMPNNTALFIDDGEAQPWLELRNFGKEDLDLNGMKLICGRKKFSLSGLTMKAGSYQLLFLSSGSGKNETGITLSAEGGEKLYIKDAEGKLVDLVTVAPQEANVAVTRAHSGESVKEATTKKSTPGFANSEKGYKKFLASRHIENETGIVINEVMASNENAYFDKFGISPDFIEIANTSKKKVDVGGFGISDNEAYAFKLLIPKKTTIKPGECLLINCSSDYAGVDRSEMNDDENVLYAPFSIKGGKEGVFLSNDKAYIIDGVEAVSGEKDKSLALTEQGTRSLTYNITPGLPNTLEGIKQFRGGTEGEKMPSDQVFISEVSSRNTKYAPVGEKYYDWIELYNPSDKDIDLNGFGLSDDVDTLGKFKFSSTKLPANSYLVVYATKTALTSATATGFELNGSSTVCLTGADGKLIDSVLSSDLLCNVSKGREGTNSQLKYFEKPTPGEKNGNGKSLISDSPTASKPSAKYEDVESLSVELFGRGTIYYTTDGSVPTTSSKKYDSPLSLKKTTVIRAISVEEDAVASAPSAFTYLINEGHSLDVVSMISDPAGIFSSSSGIYEMGGNASSVFPYLGANFWQKWKRPTTLQLISDNEPGFSADCEASIFGGYSRAYDKKSIKFKFKDIYGAGKLKYPVFANREFDEYDSLVLRAGGQDVSKAMMKDDLTTYLADPVIDVMATRPVVLYINGQYWGIYYIREKINADFVATRYNVSAESVDIIQASSYANTGTSDDWKALLAYVKSHDLSNAENYKYVTDRVDVQNYADYIIAELYCGNADAGNIRCYRTREGDSKWRWIFYDTDLGFQLGLHGSVFDLLNPAGNGASDMFTTALINGLLKNKTFRNLFVERLEYQMHNIWNLDRVLSTIDMFENALKDEVPRNHARWNLNRDWSAYVNELRTFARGRQAALRDEFATSSSLRSLIALSDEEISKCFEKSN